MLDHSLRHFKRELNNAMDNVLDFRRICKKYFLTKAPGEMDSDEEMLLAYDDGGIDGGPTGSRAHRRSKQANEGMGLLKVSSNQFGDNLKACLQELTTVRKRFKHTMAILMKGLSITERRAGDIKFLNEAFVRFNFNFYYRADTSSRV